MPWLPLIPAAPSLDDLTDVDTSGALDGDALVYDSGTDTWAPGAVGSSGSGGALPLIHVRDEKTSGTAAGGFTSGAWRTRTLNTVKVNGITGASLASNQITLPAGTFDVDAFAAAYQVGRHQLRLYNVTGAAELTAGVVAASGGADTSSAVARLQGRFVLASSVAVELQHQCAATNAATNAMGLPGWGSVEVYADIQIRQVA